MNWAEVLVMLGIGGTLGAVATVVVASGRLADSLSAFSAQLEAYLSARSDPESLRLREGFASLKSDWEALFGALRRLRLRR